MSIIGTLSVNLVAKTGGFAAGMKHARKELAGFAKDSEAAGRSWASAKKLIGAGLAAVSAGAVMSSLRQTANELDNLAKTADKLGVSTESLSSLRFGAGLSGVETSALDTALQKLSQRVSEAAKGTGEAKEAFKELGISAQSLVGKSPDKMLAVVADAMQRVENQADKVRLATKLFEEGGVSLLNMLKGGSAGLSEFRREAEELGITLDRDSLSKVEAFNDAMAKLQAAVGSFKNALVIDVAPAATAAIGALTEAVKGMRLLQTQGKGGGGGVTGLFGRLSTGQTSWQKSMENWWVRRGINNGVAMGSEAPTFAATMGAANGTVLDRAKNPFARGGPIAEALGKRAAANAAAEAEESRKNSAAAQSVKKLREGITGKASDALSSVASGGMGALRFLAEKRQQAESFSARWTLEQAFRPRTEDPEFRKRLEAIQRKAKGGDGASVEFGSNDLLTKGSAAAFAAEKSSARVNRYLQEQIMIAKAQKEALDTIAANTKQRELDDIWKMQG